MQTELFLDYAPAIYADFAGTIDSRNWLTFEQKLNADIRGNPFLRDHYQEEFQIVFQLCRLHDLNRKYGLRRGISQELYPAIAFAAQVVSLLKGMPSEKRSQLAGRVGGALKKPDAMRGLRLEMVAATHMARRGQTVVWPEVTGEGTYDLLIPSLGGGLEIECKSFSEDLGRAITKHSTLMLLNALHSSVFPAISSMTTGLIALLTVTERLP